MALGAYNVKNAQSIMSKENLDLSKDSAGLLYQAYHQ